MSLRDVELNKAWNVRLLRFTKACKECNELRYCKRWHMSLSKVILRLDSAEIQRITNDNAYYIHIKGDVYCFRLMFESGSTYFRVSPKYRCFNITVNAGLHDFVLLLMSTGYLHIYLCNYVILTFRYLYIASSP